MSLLHAKTQPLDIAYEEGGVRDRGNLGKQAEDEFANFEPSDDPRKFPTLYTVQRLKTNSINPAAKVVITTIQRLFSMLKGETEFDSGNEEGSAFDSARAWQGEPPEVAYNVGIPPEFFDFIVVDECHRSIYELWSQVLLYFDSFLTGLTATPAGKTIGFFKQNLVMQYGHNEAVTDGVNGDRPWHRSSADRCDRASLERPGHQLSRLSATGHPVKRPDSPQNIGLSFAGSPATAAARPNAPRPAAGPFTPRPGDNDLRDHRPDVELMTPRSSCGWRGCEISGWRSPLAHVARSHL